MTLSDVLAAYAAVLSSSLAVLQFVQWRQGRQFVSVKYTEYFGSDDSDSTFEITITNRGAAPVHLDYVACGWSARYLRRPWKRDAFSLIGVSKMDRKANFDGRLSGTADDCVLKQGDLLLAGFLRSTLLDQNHEREKWPFSVKPVIWIEHSQSDREICKVVSFST